MRRKNVIHHATRDVGLGGHQDEDPGRLLHVGFTVWICPSVPDAERDEIGWGRQSGAKRQACRKDGRGFETEMDPLTTETKSECCPEYGALRQAGCIITSCSTLPLLSGENGGGGGEGVSYPCQDRYSRPAKWHTKR